MAHTQLLKKARELLGKENGLSEGSFIKLYEGQLLRVLNYVRYRASLGEAEDLTANIFARVWDLRANYDPRRGTLETWLWMIARSAIADHWRGRKFSVDEALSDDLPSPHNPAEEVAQQLEWERLQTALNRLPAIDQEIIALRFGGGHTNRDISKMLELSEANVAQRIRRALRKMRLELEGDFLDAAPDGSGI